MGAVLYLWYRWVQKRIVYFVGVGAEVVHVGPIRHDLPVQVRGSKGPAEAPGTCLPAVDALQDLALASRGAKASGSKNAGLIIDGDTKFGKYKGYAWATNPCNFAVDLGAVCSINKIRILLYNLDNRRYSYRVFVSEDGDSWNQVMSNPRARGGWQEIGLEDIKLQFIRVNGLSNTENRNFHVVEIEAYGSQ